MSKSYYKGYWMVTNRCNLSCSYCVLEDAPHQLRAELDLEAKKALISHLYHKLNFRRLTLSGGEVLLIGKRPPSDFIELLRHLRQFRSADPLENLEIELYTNGTYLDASVASEMQGVVDLVAVTIDTLQNHILTQIGRNNLKFNNYYGKILQVCELLAQRNIPLKLHSVVSTKNHLILPQEVSLIFDALKKTGVKILCWKFYQYMSYDSPTCDQDHAIPQSEYEEFQKKVMNSLAGSSAQLHFKNNEEMNASLFNILSYGNAQYMRQSDSWSTSQRTEDLRNYSSMEEVFAKHDIDERRFRLFHELIGVSHAHYS